MGCKRFISNGTAAQSNLLWQGMTKHPFHGVDYRPWPLTGSVGRLCLVGGLASWIHKYDEFLMKLGLTLILLTIVQWWRDVTREATFQGKHTKKVEDGMRIGIILFFFFRGVLLLRLFLGLFPLGAEAQRGVGGCLAPDRSVWH